MNCNYKVKIQDIQTKYKFKVFCAGGGDSETKEKVDILYNIWPRVIAEGETITLDNTAEAPLEIVLNGNTSGDNVATGDNTIEVVGKNLALNDNKENPDANYSGSGAGSSAIQYDSTEQAFYTGTSRARIFNLASNNTYTFSIDTKKRTAGTLFSIYFYYYNTDTSTSSAVQSALSISSENYQRLSWTFTIPSGYNALRIILYNGLYFKNIQVEKSSTLTTYEEYKVTSYPINLGSIELNAGDSIQYLTDKWYIVRADTTQTEITDTTLINQLEALKEAQSYSGQTNILQVNNDAPFIITAKALMDLSNLGTSTVSTLNTASVNRLETPNIKSSISPDNLELNNSEEIIEETPEEE